MASLLKRAQRGDAKAAKELYEQTAPAIYSLLAYMLQDEAEAECLLEETFRDLWRSLDEHDVNSGSFCNWALLFARKKAIAHLRVTGRSKNHPLAGKIRDRLRNSRDGESDQGVLELAFYCGMNLSEISAYLDRPLGEVRCSLSRGLRDQAHRLGDTPGKFSRRE